MGVSSTSFGPGNCANPHGRPKKGKTLTDILEAELRKRDRTGDGGKVVSGKKRLAQEIVSLALDPSPLDKTSRLAALKYIYDRIDGRPDIFQHVIEDDTPQIIIAGPEADDAR